MENNIFTCETEDEYLEKKYDIHEVNNLGRNALFTSDLKKSKWLIKHGIDMYLIDIQGNNIVMNISSGDIDKAHYLLDIGFDLSYFIENPNKLDFEQGDLRSGPVGRLIEKNLAEYIAKTESKKIKKSLFFDKKDNTLFVKKRL